MQLQLISAFALQHPMTLEYASFLIHTLSWPLGSSLSSVSIPCIWSPSHLNHTNSVVLYTSYFGILVYLQSRIPVVVEPTKSDDYFKGRPSVLPLMDPELAEWRPSRASGSSSDSNSGPKSRVDPPQPARPLLPLLLPQRRQSTLPLYNQPVSMGPQRHRSLPAMHHPAGGSHRLTMTLTMPAPLATQAQPHQVPPLPSGLQPGAMGSRPPRPVVRHLSMMPPPRRGRSSSDAGSSPLAESPSRSVLSKPIPSYLM